MRARLISLAAIAIMALLFWFRVIQVGTFLAAAGVRRALSESAVIDWKANNRKWPAISDGPAGRSTGNRGGVTYHPWDHAFDVGKALESLRLAKGLGAGWLRLDVRWLDVFPNGRELDSDALEWHRRMLERSSRVAGLRNIVVLSNPPEAVLELETAEVLAAWETYVRTVADAVGPFVEVYQVFNEPNSPVFRIFDDNSEGKALSLAARIVKRRRKDTRVALNFLIHTLPWRGQFERLMAETGDDVDIVGLDTYPGTWMLSPSMDWTAVEALVREARERAAEPLWQGRTLALMETGYSTNLPLVRSSRAAGDFYDSLSGLLARCGPSAFDFLAVYELWDEDSNVFLDPEAHFGLWESTGREKPVTEAVRRLFAFLDTHS